MICTCTK